MTAMMTARLALARGQEPADLARPAERLIAGHVVAAEVARTLAEKGSLAAGHKAALYAHLVQLVQLEGEAAARWTVAILCGMVGADCVQNHVPYDPGIDDETDWASVKLT